MPKNFLALNPKNDKQIQECQFGFMPAVVVVVFEKATQHFLFISCQKTGDWGKKETQNKGLSISLK